jgi:hypothetical protein
VEMGRLSGAERDRFLRLGGLLARAELTASQAERARDLVEAADWKPLPRLPVTYQLEPLFLHHAFNLGIAGTRLFNFETPSALPPPIGWRVLGTNYYKRQRILLALVQSFARAGIARVMLIKGAALAPLYSSPALRDMADIDMVVASADSPKACEVLRAKGWRNHVTTWAHRQDCELDLLEPTPGLSAEVWERAVPHPAFAKHPQILMPALEDHAVLVALHAAKHGGERAWRDLCDLNVLLAQGADPVRALEVASRHGAAVALCVLFRLINRWGAPEAALPEKAPSWTEENEAACRLQLRLYEELLVDKISPVSLELFETMAVPPHVLARRVWRWCAAAVRGKHYRPYEKANKQAPEHDWLLNISTDKGPYQRQGRKMRILVTSLWRMEYFRYRRLIKARAQARKVGRTFGTAGTG